MDERMGSAQARMVGDELRQYRELKGITGDVLSERLGWSVSKISRIENGFTGIDEIDVVRYATHCGVTADDVDALLELCRETGASGYWLSKWSSTLIFHESAAALSASYDPLVVPGLLQTEGYATALIGVDRPWLVQLRMERQRVLHSRPFEFFVHEQALRLRVGSNRVMNEQLLKLALICNQPMITFRIVPAALGERSLFGGSFVLFRYAVHKPLIYLEHPHMGFFLEDQEHVAKFHENLANMSEAALGRGESREVLAALASEFDRPEDSPDAPDHLAEEQFQRSG